jgi:hypothetical protein
MICLKKIGFDSLNQVSAEAQSGAWWSTQDAAMIAVKTMRRELNSKPDTIAFRSICWEASTLSGVPTPQLKALASVGGHFSVNKSA